MTSKHRKEGFRPVERQQDIGFTFWEEFLSVDLFSKRNQYHSAV
jgi:hypothetical protein